MTDDQIKTMNELAAQSPITGGAHSPQFEYKGKILEDNDDEDEIDDDEGDGEDHTVEVLTYPGVPVEARKDTVGIDADRPDEEGVDETVPTTVKASRVPGLPAQRGLASIGGSKDDTRGSVGVATPRMPVDARMSEPVPPEPTPNHVLKNKAIRGSVIPDDEDEECRKKRGRVEISHPGIETRAARAKTALEKLATITPPLPQKSLDHTEQTDQDPEVQGAQANLIAALQRLEKKFDNKDPYIPFSLGGLTLKRVSIMMTVKEALLWDLTKAEQAIMAEFGQLDEKQVFEIIKKYDFTPEQK